MRICVDLDTCADEGQCVLAAPAVFQLDEDGRQAFRRQTSADTYLSDELDESLRQSVERAVGDCPMQAITIVD